MADRRWSRISARALIWAVGVVGGLSGAAGGWAWMHQEDSAGHGPHDAKAVAVPQELVEEKPDRDGASVQVVRLDLKQQKSIGLETEDVEFETTPERLTAPGRITPDESRYAYIDARAAGVIRAVGARVGQEVKAGDVLATIDSPEVAAARLGLIGRTQELEVAESRLAWERSVFETTFELIERIEAGDSPDEIHRRFAGKPIGETREHLITAYAKYRLSEAKLARSRSLVESSSIARSLYEEIEASYHVDRATYQALMDRIRYEEKLALSKAEQEQRQAAVAVRVAQERLRVLGVDAPAVEIPILAASGATATGAEGAAEPSVSSPGNGPSEPRRSDANLSTYLIRAPFDGTVIDRDAIVPGVSVELAERLYTLSDLSTVWLEAHIPETEFRKLRGRQDLTVEFSTRSYPGHVFPAEVLFAGDLVDPKTLAVRFVAKAANEERRLKPGMYVDVTIRTSGTMAAIVPDSALLTEGDRTFVYVRRGDETFEKKDVVVESSADGRAIVREGLAPGDEVVSQGGFKLKAVARYDTATDDESLAGAG